MNFMYMPTFAGLGVTSPLSFSFWITIFSISTSLSSSVLIFCISFSLKADDTTLFDFGASSPKQIWGCLSTMRRTLPPSLISLSPDPHLHFNLTTSSYPSNPIQCMVLISLFVFCSYIHYTFNVYIHCR